MCPDGSCQNSHSQCGNYGDCEINRPYSCDSAACVPNLKYCYMNLFSNNFKQEIVYFDPIYRNDDFVYHKTMKNNKYDRVLAYINYDMQVFFPSVFGPCNPMLGDNVDHCGKKDPQSNSVTEPKKRDLQHIDYSKYKDMLFVKNNSNEINGEWWKSLKKKSVLTRLDNKAQMLIQPVSTNDLKLIKNKMTDSEINFLRAILKRYISRRVPLNITLKSVPIKLSTMGRFDDNEPFYHGPCIKFSVKSFAITFLGFKFNKGHEKYVKMINSFMCLGYANELTKEWSCVNRNPKKISKLRRQGILVHYIEYEIPFPGTFAVILKPMDNLPSTYKQVFDNYEPVSEHKFLGAFTEMRNSDG